MKVHAASPVQQLRGPVGVAEPAVAPLARGERPGAEIRARRAHGVQGRPYAGRSLKGGRRQQEGAAVGTELRCEHGHTVELTDLDLAANT
jgi:hypothetical protein